MWTINKIDAEYIALKDDQRPPAKGERFYYRSPRALLANIARDCRDNGAPLTNVAIYPNEHADAALIKSFGFTVAT